MHTDISYQIRINMGTLHGTISGNSTTRELLAHACFVTVSNNINIYWWGSKIKKLSPRLLRL